MFDLSQHIKNSLEQEIEIDYYKILGLARNANTQQICSRSLKHYSATEI